MTKTLLRVLYIGDVMAKPGRQAVRLLLPQVIETHKPDLIIAQSENVTHGVGMSPDHMHELQSYGVQAFTGGNHSLERTSLLPLLAEPMCPVLAPANMHASQVAWGVKTVATPKGAVLLVSLLGDTFPRSFGIDNPLKAIDSILAGQNDHDYVATIVNFHGDFSSEKRVIGYYLDGRVSAVIGDHWHVPTADAQVLPLGTAHITDVGMCGTVHSSLGVSKEHIIARWRDDVPTKNVIAEDWPLQFNAVLVTIDTKTRLGSEIKPIRLRLESEGSSIAVEEAR